MEHHLTTYITHDTLISALGFPATQENLEGRGPCYLRTEGIEKEKDTDLKKAYLNMAPSRP